MWCLHSSVDYSVGPIDSWRTMEDFLDNIDQTSFSWSNALQKIGEIWKALHPEETPSWLGIYQCCAVSRWSVEMHIELSSVCLDAQVQVCMICVSSRHTCPGHCITRSVKWWNQMSSSWMIMTKSRVGFQRVHHGRRLETNSWFRARRQQSFLCCTAVLDISGLHVLSSLLADPSWWASPQWSWGWGSCPWWRAAAACGGSSHEAWRAGGKDQGQDSDQNVTCDQTEVTAEQTAVTAEQTKVTAEQTAVTAEQTAVTAEQTEDTAEQNEVTAEEARSQAASQAAEQAASQAAKQGASQAAEQGASQAAEQGASQAAEPDAFPRDTARSTGFREDWCCWTFVFTFVFIVGAGPSDETWHDLAVDICDNDQQLNWWCHQLRSGSLPHWIISDVNCQRI